MDQSTQLIWVLLLIVIAFACFVQIAITNKKRLERRIAELEKFTQWQPIETAPDDGRLKLLLSKDRYGIAMCIGEKIDGKYRDNARDIPSNPTHWMPIPDPPKE